MVLLSVLAALLMAQWSLVSPQTIINVEGGSVSGVSMTTFREGFPYEAFYGIPYGKPPIGSLRFQEPQPAEPWEGVRNATQYGNECLQFSYDVIVGDEDCLYLNVFTPELYPTDLLPVMVWIYGGSFNEGASNIYGPEFLIPYGVVLVTLNYRLGPFGFLSFLNSNVPGNAGLKDQKLALQWVKQNIASFGGNPNDVTIFGQSAGGASVHAHVLSSQSTGLFQRAVSQSGTMMCFWALTTDPESQAQRLANNVGCNRTNVDDVINCLMALPADTILNAVSSVIQLDDIFQLNVIPFTPVVDGGIEGVPPFLPEHPKTMLTSGNFNKEVPFIAGVASAEATFLLSLVPNATEYVDYLDNNILSLIPFPGGTSTNIITTVIDNIIAFVIKLFYFGFSAISTATLTPIMTYISDFAFIWPIQWTVRQQAAKSSKPQYFYYFDYVGEMSYVKESLNPIFQGIPGAAHGDDVYYLFNTNMTDMSLPSNSSAMIMKDKLTTLWTNFAATSNPTPIIDPLLDNVTWLTYTDSSKNYLYIGDSLSMESNLRIMDMIFWDITYFIIGLGI